jgi:hypothetical protein
LSAVVLADSKKPSRLACSTHSPIMTATYRQGFRPEDQPGEKALDRPSRK